MTGSMVITLVIMLSIAFGSDEFYYNELDGNPIIIQVVDVDSVPVDYSESFTTVRTGLLASQVTLYDSLGNSSSTGTIILMYRHYRHDLVADSVLNGSDFKDLFLDLFYGE